MVKFILSAVLWRKAIPNNPSTSERLQWMRDPLSHPALQQMGERELADLPFRR